MKALALQSHSSTRRLALVIVVLGLLALSLLVLGDPVVNWTAANAETGAAALASAHQSAATVNDRLELASSVMGGKASGLRDLSGGSLIPPLAATTPPTITSRLDPPSPDGYSPWYKNPVSVIWEWSGNMLSSANPSGAPCPPSAVPISNTIPLYCLGVASAPVMRDGQAPNAPKVIAKNPDGSTYPDTDNNWVNHNVYIKYEPNGDNGPSKGVTCVKPDETIDKDQNADAGTNCTDAAGNIGPTGSIHVRRDTTGPYTNPTLDQVPKVPGQQWYTPPLNINWNWQDAGIGVDKARCTTPSTPVLGEGELTLPISTTTITCYDMLGNLGRPAPFTVKVDGTKPKYFGVATAKSKNAAYNQWTWTNDTVTASFRCEDKLSGPIGAVPPVTRTTVTVDWNQEGADMTIPAAPALCKDKAGNEADGGASYPHVFLDSTPPVVAHTASPEPNAYLWNNTPVTVTFNCGDALSGVKDGITNPIDVKNVSKEGAGVPVPNSGTCIDKATNVAVAYTATVNIDLTPPEITPLQPVGTALIGCGTKPQFQVTDALSGLDPARPYTVSDAVPTPLDNGTFVSRYTVTAWDKAGNVTSQKFDYLVYNIGDPFWLSPINPNGTSVFNLGSTVPIKFTLFDCNNQPVTNADARLKVVWGGPTPPAGEVQEDTKVGNADTGNKFRRTGEYYQFNWSTKGLWVGKFDISVMIGGLPLRTTTIGLK